MIEPDPPSPEQGFRHKTVNGVKWSVASQIGTQGIGFVTIVILARLLSPREFGLLAMVTVIASFAQIFSEMGFSSALVQKQDIEQKHLSSVFWLNLGMGGGLTLLFIAGAPLIARFYDEPILIPLTWFISFNFLIGSLTIVQKTMLTKTIDFRSLSIVNIVAVALSGVVAIGLAFGGAGIWSLAVQSVLLSTITTIMLWRLSHWRPAFIFNWDAIKDLLGFSLSLFGTKLLSYWTRNLDYLLIGRFIGLQPLGVYKNAYTIMLFPLSNVSRVISQVMFPSLSLIQDDKAKVRQLFVRMTRTIALVTFPMMAGLFVVADSFVLTLFGPQWSAMIPILMVFCLTGLMQSIGTLNGNLYLSQGRADLQLRVGLVLKMVGIMGIVVGLRWGALGVAVGYTVASLINSYPSFYFAGKLVDLNYWQIWNKLLGTLGCALSMAVVVWGVGQLVDEWPHWLRLIVQVPFAILFYSLLIHIFRLQAYLEMRDLVMEQLHSYLSNRNGVSVAMESEVDG